MAVEISKVFRANVKAIRMHLSDGSDKSDILNEEIFASKSKKTPNVSKTNQSFVKEAAQISGDDRASQIDRQNFEDQAESIMSKCGNALKQLKENAFKQIHSPQYKEHLENVFYLVEKYLEDVCKIYSEQKAIRFNRIIQEKNLSQLCSKEIEFLSRGIEAKDVSSEARTKPSDHEEIEREERDKGFKTGGNENQLSEQELLSLEKENEVLYDNLTIQSEEVKKIESEVIEVSRLAEIFTQNIVSQLSSVESIKKSVFETNSNLTTGNQSIKEAMRKNAALRVWILFILIVLSFTLLFLDWYND